jgi:hypothetical protein
LKVFAGLEPYSAARRNGHFGPGSGISSDAGFAGAHIEDAEAAEFDALAPRQGSLQGIEDRVYGDFGLASRKAGSLNHLLNNVLFNHSYSSRQFFLSDYTLSLNQEGNHSSGILKEIYLPNTVPSPVAAALSRALQPITVSRKMQIRAD